MMLRFSAENYKLFKERTALSLDATADKSLSDSISVIEAPNRKYRVLRSAMVYGANASGKTKFFEALQLMRNFVCASHTHLDGSILNYTPYPGSKECSNRPTSFEIEFIHENIRYIYGFSYNRERITEEHLYHYPKGREATVFLRNNDGYEFPSDRTFQQGNARRVRSNSLYVSVSALFNHGPSMKVVEWFSKKLITMINVPLETKITVLVDRMAEDRRFAEFVNRALRIADFGICGIYDKNHKKRKNDQVASQSNPFVIQEPPNIFVKHIVDGVQVEFPIQLESSGTIRFLALMGPVIDSLLDGKTLVIDEIEMSFHTDICRWVTELFTDPAENRNDAQMIFNTHETELIDLYKVRRDQIWFVSKDNRTAIASFCRLSDIKGIRKDLDIRKAYLNGSFGAKPFIEPSTLMEEE